MLNNTLSSVRRSADLQSAANKCPNLFMPWGYVIPSNQDVVCHGNGGFQTMQRDVVLKMGLEARRRRNFVFIGFSSLPFLARLYFMLSELVMVLPSIRPAPFSSNSDRQRRSENFWDTEDIRHFLGQSDVPPAVR